MENETFAGPARGIENEREAGASTAIVRAGRAARDEPNGVFSHLVKDDADITGLVAYSIYKQNKLDWLAAFESAKGRVPEDSELAAYIIGEGTARRLATYRHLAEATLAGKGPEVDGPGRAAGGLRRVALGEARALPPALLVAYVAVGLLVLAGLWLAARYTMATH